jgi:hypothetical protein
MVLCATDRDRQPRENDFDIVVLVVTEPVGCETKARQDIGFWVTLRSAVPRPYGRVSLISRGAVRMPSHES